MVALTLGDAPTLDVDKSLPIRLICLPITMDYILCSSFNPEKGILSNVHFVPEDTAQSGSWQVIITRSTKRIEIRLYTTATVKKL